MIFEKSLKKKSKSDKNTLAAVQQEFSNIYGYRYHYIITLKSYLFISLYYISYTSQVKINLFFYFYFFLTHSLH